MAKKLTMMLVVCSMMAVLMPLMAEQEEANGYTWTYQIYGDTAEIYGNLDSITPCVSPNPTGVVTIPSTLGGKPVTSIGEGAFFLCTGLTSVTIPDSVTNIGSYAFADCRGLTNVTIPDSVTSIGPGAFSSGSSGLTAFVVGNGNPSYKSVSGLLLTKDGKTLVAVPAGLTSVTISNSVTSIGDGAFYNCSRLTSVTIPDGVTSIGEHAFQGCSGLTSMTIPDNVTSIGNSAFYRCSGLTSVMIPNSVTNIERYAFSNCSGLTNATVNQYVCSRDMRTIFPSAYQALKDVVIAGGVTNIGVGVFSNCTELASIAIPASVKRVGKNAFYGCTNLRHLDIADLSAWYDVDFDGYYSLPHYSYRGVLTVGGVALNELAIPDDVTEVKYGLFYGCTNLTSVTFHDQVKSIGGYAFYGCSGLTSVTIPSSVTNIGGYAFFGCSGLTNLMISSGVKSIGRFAFSGCSRLANVTIPEGVTSLETAAFQWCSGLGSVIVPASVTSIAGQTFMSCSSLTSIVFHGNAPTIESSTCFSGVNASCTVYVGKDSSGWDVEIPGTWKGMRIEYLPGREVLTISNGVLTAVELNGETMIVIPHEVMAIGVGVFSNCTDLAQVTLQDGVASVGDFAFYGCSNLTNVTLYGDAPALGASCFAGVSDACVAHVARSSSGYGTAGTWNGMRLEYLKPVFIIDGNALTAVELYGNTAVEIPGNVGYIKSDAFSNCSDLERVTMPASLYAIYPRAFYLCSNLTNVVFSGNAPANVAGNAFYGVSQRCTVYVKSGSTGWGVDIPGTWNGMRIEYLAEPPLSPTFTIENGVLTAIELNGVSNVAIPGNVTAIGNRVFYGCTELRNILIPNSVTNIGGAAFFGCSALTSVTIGNGVTSIGSEAFGCCSNLTSVAIPDSVASIDSYAFDRCTSLMSVTIPDGVRSIGYEAFYKCSSLTNVTIPNSVTNIGSAAFNACSNLTSMTLPFVGARRGNSGTSDALFGHIFGTFSDSASTLVRQYYSPSSSVSHYIPPSLKSVTITDETLIGYGAFYGCSSLTNIAIPNSVTNIGDAAFTGCRSLTSATVNQYVCSQNMIAIFPSAFQKLADVVIAGGVTNIGVGVFSNCTKLASITIPDSVKSVGSYAFYYCSGLTSVTIPDSVKSVGARAFYSCRGLTSVTIPDSVTSVGSYAFYNCSSLTDVMIGYGVNNIGTFAFYKCSGLTNLTIGTGARSIGASAFRDCTSLRSVTIPASVTSIGYYVFSGCSNMVSIDVANGNTSYLSVDGLLLSKDGNTLVAVPCGLTNIAVPANVGSIGVGAFAYCSGLTSATIPNSVTNIGSYAFYNCRGLKSVTMLGDEPITQDSIYSTCPDDLVTYVPLAWTGPTDVWQYHAVSVVFGASTLHGDRVNVSTNWICETLGVPVDWFSKQPSSIEALLDEPAANGTRSVAECYALGIDPDDPADDFQITRFWMEDGKPRFEFSHTADGSGRSFEPRIYKVGKANLSDDWSPVPDGGNPAYRFFKVVVELP